MEVQAFLMVSLSLMTSSVFLLIALGYFHLTQPLMLVTVLVCLVFRYLLVLMRREPWPLAVLVALGCLYGLLRTCIHPFLASAALGFWFQDDGFAMSANPGRVGSAEGSHSSRPF